MIILEPKWKSWIVETTTPLFTPDQCQQIIECGHRQKPQKAQVGMGKPGGGTDTKKRVTTERKSVILRAIINFSLLLFFSYILSPKHAVTNSKSLEKITKFPQSK